MKININCEKIELTNAIRSYVEDKTDALERFINTDNENLIADITIGKTTQHHHKGNFYKAEVQLSTPMKKFFAKAQKDDLYAAIDEVQDILKREIIKHKEMVIDKRKSAE